MPRSSPPGPVPQPAPMAGAGLNDDPAGLPEAPNGVAAHVTPDAALAPGPPTLLATTRLVLVRHGETAWNLEGRMQGQTDTALNETGRRQAANVAEVLQRAGVTSCVEAVVSSDLARARETAEAIAQMCPGAQRAEDPGLREFHAGSLQGLLQSEIGKVRSKVSRAWSRGDLEAAYPGPGGESPAAVIGRGLGALRCAARLGSCVVVVSHGGLIKWCAMAIELGTECPAEDMIQSQRAQDVLKYAMSNCCCSTVLYDHQSGSFNAERWFDAFGASGGLRDTG